MPALGERIRATREARGLSLSDVAEQIRIRSVYLAAIEDQNWSAIGAPVYVRGFLRTYARYLGLDPEEAVSEFAAASGQPASSAAPGRSAGLEPREQRSLRPILWVAGIIAAGLVGFVIYLYLSPPRAASVATAVPPSAPA